MTTEEPWKELYGYWRSRQVDGRAPKRSELDIPVEIPRLLANVMLIDCIGDRLQYRLVGSALWDRYQAELTGTWIEERSPPEAEWRETIALVRDDGAPRLVSSPIAGDGSKSHIAVALPLLDDGGRVFQILAGTFYAQEYGDNLRVGRLKVQEILDGDDHPAM
jgi:hypothetical protein